MNSGRHLHLAVDFVPRNYIRSKIMSSFHGNLETAYFRPRMRLDLGESVDFFWVSNLFHVPALAMMFWHMYKLGHKFQCPQLNLS